MSLARKASTDAWWLTQIAAHDAIVIDSLTLAGRYPDRAIAFETRNFGWILSARDKRGVRHILLKY